MIVDGKKAKEIGEGIRASCRPWPWLGSPASRTAKTPGRAGTPAGAQAVHRPAAPVRDGCRVDLNTVPADCKLYSVVDADLPADFIEAYRQVTLDVGVGGHGLRSWAVHADAAFVGQWALTYKSAIDARETDRQKRIVLHYPVLARVIDAAAAGVGPTMPIVSDVRVAWDRSLELTRKALGFGLTSHNSQVAELGAWVNSTEGDIANIACMPDKAQRELSASVVALQVFDFKCHIESSTHWDAARRVVNWLTCQGRVAGRWTQVVPWDRHGHLNMNNTAYVVAFCRRYRLERPHRLRGRTRDGFDGDYDECDDPQRQWAKTLVHHTIVDAIARFVRDCGMTKIRTEFKYWDPVREGTDGSRRVPDVTCLDPRTNTEYVIDARIFWNSMSDGASGYTAYQWTGWGATHGEQEKRTSWKKALRRRQAESTHHIEFVPFSMEAGGVWGPAAQKFFNDCASKADNLDRDIDLYHWSSAKFCSAWRDTMSVLVARGRAQVGVHAAKADWSKRIRDFQFMDYDDHATHH